MAAPLMIASAAASAVSNIADGFAQAQQHKNQAAQANFRAGVAEQNIKTVGVQSSLREDAARRTMRQENAADRAAAAQSGLAGTTDTLVSQNAANREMDVLNQRYEGSLAITDLANERSSQLWQAKASKAAAKSAVVGGFLNAGASLLSSASNYKAAGGSFGKGR